MHIPRGKVGQRELRHIAIGREQGSVSHRYAGEHRVGRVEHLGIAELHTAEVSVAISMMRGKSEGSKGARQPIRGEPDALRTLRMILLVLGECSHIETVTILTRACPGDEGLSTI